MPDALFVQQPGITYTGLEMRRLLGSVYQSPGIIDGLQISVTNGVYSIGPGACVISDNAGGYYYCYFDSTSTGPVPTVASGTRNDLLYVQVNDPGDGQAVVGRANGVTTLAAGTLQTVLGTLTTTVAGTATSGLQVGRRYAERAGHRQARVFNTATRDLTAGLLGERGIEVDTWLFWVHDGTGWCIQPGQVLFHGSFEDSAYQRYTPGYQRIGQSGGRDSNFFWRRPRCLPNHGFRVAYRFTPLIGGNNPGDVLISTLFRYPNGPIGAPSRMVSPGGPANDYNDSITDTQVFDGGDFQLGVAGDVINICVAATIATGLTRIQYGDFMIESL